jgi:hypothetical protein
MSGTHSDLFVEIGKLVVAAHGGEPIDLTSVSEELASRYANLNVSADAIARAVARSLGAVGVSMALIAERRARGQPGEILPFAGSVRDGEAAATLSEEPEGAAKSALFPSGVRLAVLP